ncbi:uncharacterized protein LOC110250456 [Exaiptasia diaphana]|uniref:Uncharacterized protein n=1 Tax=Exaiptasia diaphana TaxID=2652724 RepID=A0A913Y0A7_EXADI|nr:uncharacterized protein LOC110250456 [Exaiptasia diaphana]KXJ23476.1 hypothetical protein AC249_AIPGENE7231 [Exaiptasia diaphana]
MNFTTADWRSEEMAITTADWLSDEPVKELSWRNPKDWGPLYPFYHKSYLIGLECEWVEYGYLILQKKTPRRARTLNEFKSYHVQMQCLMLKLMIGIDQRIPRFYDLETMESWKTQMVIFKRQVRCLERYLVMYSTSTVLHSPIAKAERILRDFNIMENIIRVGFPSFVSMYEARLQEFESQTNMDVNSPSFRPEPSLYSPPPSPQ